MQVQNWNELEMEQMSPLVGRQVIHGANITLARLTLKKGAVVPEHHHINEQMATVISGKLVFLMEGERHVLNAGETLVVAPNVPHSVEVLEDSIVFDTFAPTREDWLRGEDAYLRK
ncbi:MAG TPA: cupin domain-containing protein [Bryobacteraceae bacterium]|nr:cupin domain-containing protein [Bryobacteraceae bacterium]